MNAPTRALLTLLAAGATGALLWVSAQLDTQSSDGYWAAHALIAAGGLLLGLAQFRSATGRPALPLLVVAPAVLAALWLVAVADPDSNTVRNHLREWGSDLGIAGAVSDIARWNGALALGLGLLIGLTFSPRLLARRRRESAPPVTAAPAPAPAPARAPAPVVEEPAADALDEPAAPVAAEEPEGERVTQRVGPPASGT
jgi:hypothetical protein